MVLGWDDRAWCWCEVEEAFDCNVEGTRAQTKLCEWVDDDHPHCKEVEGDWVAVLWLHEVAGDFVRDGVAEHEVSCCAGNECDCSCDELIVSRGRICSHEGDIEYTLHAGMVAHVLGDTGDDSVAAKSSQDKSNATKPVHALHLGSQ